MSNNSIKFLNDCDYKAQIHQFVKALLQVQQRHYYWFESRHGELKTQEHDVIGNHVIITVEFPELIFVYWKESQLPENIRIECNACFDQVFKGHLR